MVLILAIWLSGPVFAQTPEELASRVLQRVHSRASQVDGLEAEVHLTRTDPRFLRCFFVPSALNLKAVMGFEKPDDFDLHLWQGGARWFRFDSRAGFNLRFSGLVRLGGGPAVVPPPPETSPDPDLGFADLTQDSAETFPFHPLCFLWPPRMWQALPGHTPTLEGSETLFGRACLRVGLLLDNGMRARIWADRLTFEPLRMEFQPPGGRGTLLADYRWEPGAPCWSQVEVYADRRPLFQAVAVEPRVDPSASRLPDLSLVLRRPAGITARAGPSTLQLPDWAWGILRALALALAILAARFLYHLLRRRTLARELILLDRADGPWARRLQRLGYPVARFSPECVSQELQILDRGRAVATDDPPRAILVAPGAGEQIRTQRYLLRSFVQAGGRVLVLAHDQARDLPFDGELTRITRAELRGVHFDPAGPWRRLEPRRVAELVLERGCEACLVSLEGRPLEQDLVGLRAADSRQATVIGLSRQGLGEWLVCQVPFPESVKDWPKDLSALLCELVDLLEGYPSPEA
jgi:hypothetical protein